MPPRAGSRSIAGTGGRSGASSDRSSSQPQLPATTSARTSPPPCRSAFEASSSNTRSRPSRASSVDPEETEGCAMRARRSARTRDTTGIDSSCQCQTSPGTDGTGADGHCDSSPGGPWSRSGSRAGCSPIDSPSRLLRGRGLGPDRDHPRRKAAAAQWAETGPAVTGKIGRVEALLRRLSRVVMVDRTLEEILTEITDIAAEGIPGAESTSTTLIRADKAFTAAHSGEMALAADELQYAHGYGPCIDAGRGGVVLRIDDVREESRWPDYMAHVQETGVRSSLSVPLPYQGASVGALNVYSSEAAAFAAPESLEAGLEVAETIAVAVVNADAHHKLGEQARNMRLAMDSRAVIEQAKGVLMAQRHVDSDQAFEILREASQRYNRKLRDIALGIVASTQDQRAR